LNGIPLERAGGGSPQIEDIVHCGKSSKKTKNQLILKLSYKNIWRNKRRTLITAASILFAVFFAVLMKSIQVGAWGYMVDQVVNYYFGYGQIHTAGYWDEQNIDKAFALDGNWQQYIDPKKGIEDLVPRLESFALAAKGESSKGTLLIGVDPAKEDLLTHLSTRVTKGKYFNGEKGLLVAEGLAEYLKVETGDTMVLISQGYHGVNAAGKYAITGLVSFGSPELNNQMVFLTLPEAQEFYGAPGLATSLVIKTNHPDNIKMTVNRLRKQLDAEAFEVLDYEELMPELIEAKKLDEAGGDIIILILYAIIGFGIFGTMLMMLKEREYEFGILKAIGMKPGQINWMVWLETVFLGFLGCLSGMLLALPIVYYLTINPIRFSGEMAQAYEKFGVEPVLPATVDSMVFLTQALIIFIMITIMGLYPMWKIIKMKPVEAMRQ
jgi:ABC-type lipoprotein release transport system permease subunit